MRSSLLFVVHEMFQEHAETGLTASILKRKRPGSCPQARFLPLINIRLRCGPGRYTALHQDPPSDFWDPGIKTCFIDGPSLLTENCRMPSRMKAVIDSKHEPEALRQPVLRRKACYLDFMYNFFLQFVILSLEWQAKTSWTSFCLLSCQSWQVWRSYEKSHVWS